MKELLYLLRAMHIYSHNCHHLVKGPLFFGDHEFFNDAYTQLLSDYDSVAERIVGMYTDEALQLQELMVQVSNKLQDAPSTGAPDNKVFFEHQLKMENRLTDLIAKIVQVGVSNGTEQLITEISNKSEPRKYFIKQRIK
jgi:DNA-binding ferritin-like protein